MVGTDNSPGANRALNEAADLAARLGAELIIVYVQPSHLTEDLERLRFIEHASMDEIFKSASLEILGRAKDGAKEIGATGVRIVPGAGGPASFIARAGRFRRLGQAGTRAVDGTADRQCFPEGRKPCLLQGRLSAVDAWTGQVSQVMQNRAAGNNTGSSRERYRFRWNGPTA